jgi:HAD superfamily hydrolase (TIGR01509 family)
VRGVILDFDGVVVKSMELHAEAYRRVLAPYDLTFPDRAIFLLEGATSEEIIEHLLGEHDVDHDERLVKKLADEKQSVYQSLGPPKLYLGAEKMVRDLRAVAPKMGLVTGTRRENLEKYIPTLLPLFDKTLSAGEYRRGKPDPEPYAKTVQALGLKAAECACVENAPRGVASAKAAGLGLVVAITTTVDPADLERADVVVRRHQDATRHLAAWLRGKAT